MDRCAVLVDVGYLLAEGGKAYVGATTRSQVRCDYAAVSDALETFAVTRSGLPALRSYWYDGAPDNVATHDHQLIGALPRVKLRLGRLVERRRGKSEQKGVDSLIVHDLITLAHERAISTVFLVAGDEDLREGVAAAQRLGVQVILVGIPTSRPNQSDPLVREADELVLVRDDLLQPHFSRAGVAPSEDAERGAGVAVEGDAEGAIRDAARSFAREWASAAELSEIGELLTRAPQIPKQLDVQLLVAAEEAVAVSLRGVQSLRHALRESFWDELEAQARHEAREATTPSEDAL